ncbi:hypothetical protein GS905_11695 [Rhodococcus hoagii]|uniref:hypothetical protein n=1 Tax=Rhodococcus hoagii TaxID=43767 RepID=UPI000A11E98E|nr:hypothetical protein [Prescottella equi]MBM4548704.1 hypothetical protein [Prescottella equi]MBM4570361.1 hypothetical protein [Prescottella equi]MBM4615093.1 hypothetical protein [Prescottella equi]MBM4616349.1 hypothetical protein [Prescottella equi]MBM4702447.1 hypothetical protein [Prescottella equi]
MHDKNTAETLEEAIARLEAIADGSITHWSLDRNSTGYNAIALIPLEWEHPAARVGRSAKWLNAFSADRAGAVSALADKVAEASRIRGAA